MEWAIDIQGKLHLLQARPITATYAHSNRLKVVDDELTRLNKTFSEETSWDGQTFAEWQGIPSFLTHSIWKRAFSPEMAFDKALKLIGYRSFVKEEYDENDSVLNRIFGRPYINLEKMLHLYFGPIPYKLKPLPRPHLKFDWDKINFKSFIRTPLSLWNMISVGWTLSSRRRFWRDRCYKELASFKHKMERPTETDVYADWNNEDLLKRFISETTLFSKHDLKWPFVLIVLTESTLHTLEAILENVFGKEESKKKLKHWMAIGLKTITYDMNRSFKQACESPTKRPFFLSRYGHRAAGELELSNPRWVEMGDKAFLSGANFRAHKKIVKKNAVEKEIESLKTFKKSIILQEWKLLKSLLELRELWKLEILKPFAQIRFMTEELAKRSGLGKDIYFLTVDEIVEARLYIPENITPQLRELIKNRKSKEQIFKLYSFPPVLTLEILEKVIKGEELITGKNIKGESLSPGLVYGNVKVITNLNLIDESEFPEDMIIVTESTDPGWTPLFAKSKGVIVEKGGILSHSAIVAREMGIPAISGIRGCTTIFKDGDRICLDANKSVVSFDNDE